MSIQDQKNNRIVFIHAGMHKTGSTYLQHYFAKNRKYLKSIILFTQSLNIKIEFFLINPCQYHSYSQENPHHGYQGNCHPPHLLMILQKTYFLI